MRVARSRIATTVRRPQPRLRKWKDFPGLQEWTSAHGAAVQAQYEVTFPHFGSLVPVLGSL